MRVGTSEREEAPRLKNSAAAPATMHIQSEAFVKEMSYPPISIGTIGITSNCSMGDAATRPSFPFRVLGVLRRFFPIHLLCCAHDVENARRDAGHEHDDEEKRPG